jgi:hypothetical protein
VLARELSIVFRSRLVWLQAALSALLVGHGFVLAVDIFNAGSRSVRGNALMAREFDPLLGIVRPTLGGLYLAVSLLGPLAAARGLAIEKERRGYHALVLQVGSPLRVALTKWLAGISAVGLQAIAPLVLLVVWVVAGGHIRVTETAVAFAGHALYMVLVASIALAAAAWTETLAQAATIGILVVAASWAIDAAEGFAALAWLGRALGWSITTHLAPLEQGELAIGGVSWLVAMSIGAVALGWLGMRFDLSRLRRSAIGFVIVLLAVLAGQVHNIRRGLDLTEARRLSLPREIALAVAKLPGPIRITVNLDRDDARRRQLESSVLSRIRLARPDVEVDYPLDERPAPTESDRDEGYGKLLIRSGAGSRETYSTSRREIVTLILEAAGAPLPDWKETDYRGYPLVVDGAWYTAISAVAYAGIPGALLLVGSLVTRPTRRPR